MDTSTSKWNRWLEIVSLVNAVAATGFAVLPLVAPDVFAAMIEAVWVGAPPDGGMSATAAFTTAIAGGLWAGFSVLILLLARSGAVARDAAVRRAVIVSLVVWYVVDSSASVAAGAGLNAVANALLGVWFVPALIGLGRSGAADSEAVTAS